MQYRIIYVIFALSCSLVSCMEVVTSTLPKTVEIYEYVDCMFFKNDATVTFTSNPDGVFQYALYFKNGEGLGSACLALRKDRRFERLVDGHKGILRKNFQGLEEIDPTMDVFYMIKGIDKIEFDRKAPDGSTVCLNIDMNSRTIHLRPCKVRRSQPYIDFEFRPDILTYEHPAEKFGLAIGRGTTQLIQDPSNLFWVYLDADTYQFIEGIPRTANLQMDLDAFFKCVQGMNLPSGFFDEVHLDWSTRKFIGLDSQELFLLMSKLVKREENSVLRFPADELSALGNRTSHGTFENNKFEQARARRFPFRIHYYPDGLDDKSWANSVYHQNDSSAENKWFGDGERSFQIFTGKYFRSCVLIRGQAYPYSAGRVFDYIECRGRL